MDRFSQGTIEETSRKWGGEAGMKRDEMEKIYIFHKSQVREKALIITEKKEPVRSKKRALTKAKFFYLGLNTWPTLLGF